MTKKPKSLEKKCKHIWIPMPLLEFRGRDHCWHKLQQALCEKCLKEEIVSDFVIKDFV